MKRLLPLILSFFLFFMLIMPLVFSTYTDIELDGSIFMGYGDRAIVVSSSGMLHTVYFNSTSLVHAYSSDNGATWSNITVHQVGADITDYDYKSLAIDSNDVLHLVYVRWDTAGAGWRKLYYRKYTSSWSSATELVSTQVAGIVMGSTSIATDVDNNVHIIYGYWVQGDNTYLKYFKYTKSLAVWSSSQLLYDGGAVGTYSVNAQGVQCSPTSNYVHVIFRNSNVIDSYGNVYHMYYNPYTLLWSSPVSITSFDAVNKNDVSSSSLAVRSSVCHLAYEQTLDGGKSTIQYRLYSGGSWSSNTTIGEDSSYDQKLPSISINSNNDINIVWYAKSVDTPSYQVRSRTCSGGSWGSIYWQTSGTTDKIVPELLYQPYPYYNILTDGFCLVFDNETGITYSDSGSLIWYGGEDEGEPLSSCSPYDTIGMVGIGEDFHTIVPDAKYIWTVYSVAENMTVKRVDLQITSTMAGMGASNFMLKINQYDLGVANSLTQITGYVYVLSWTGLDLHILGESHILFKAINPYYVYSTTHGSWLSWFYWFQLGLPFYTDVTQSYYWDIPLTESDLDGDNGQLIKFMDAVYGGYWDNFNDIYEEETPGEIALRNADLIMRMCVQRGNETTPHDEYIDTIYFDPDICKRNETVSLNYQFSTSSMGYTKLIYVEHGGVIETGFPLTVLLPDGVIYFTPTEEGVYYANLSVNTVNISTDVLTVIGEVTEYVYSKPNPSNPCQVFTIFYSYPYTLYDGIIEIRDTEGNAISGKGGNIGKNTIGNTTEFICESGLYYIVLKQESTNWVVDMRPHTVSTGFNNNLFLSDDKARVGDEITVWGTHNRISQNVWITDNNANYIYVGDGSSFTKTYECMTSGLHTIGLIYYETDGTPHILDSKTLTISGESTDEDAPSVLPKITDPLIAGILGVFLTIGFTLLPLLATKYVNKGMQSTIQLPAFVYMIFAGCGVILSVFAGFWDWTVPFFIITLMFLMVAFTYLKGAGHFGGQQ